MSALPLIRSKHSVCVICEGYEDYHYFKRLMNLNEYYYQLTFIPCYVIICKCRLFYLPIVIK